MISSSDNSSHIRGRINAILILLIITVFFYLFRIFYMQIIKYKKYEKLSLNNITRIIKIEHPRGLIMDKSGQVLVDNRSDFILSIDDTSFKQKKFSKTLSWLNANLDHSIDTDISRLKREVYNSQNKEYIIKKNLSMDDVIKINENLRWLKGINIDKRLVRNYIFGKEFSHIIGYVGEINTRRLRKLRALGYKKGDFIGLSGVEEAEEKYLRGKDGEKVVRVDVYGKHINTINVKKPVPGDKVYLTIVKKLQDAAARALRHKKGAVVALDPRDGRILVYISSPGFNPNKFSYGISADEWSSLISDTDHPLLDRASQTQVSPGSTFKVVTALAALNDNMIGVDTVINSTGSIEVGGETFTGWKKGGLGELNLTDAIAQSGDIYFYNVGMIAGIDRLDSMARLLGIGEAPVINLKNVAKGLMPSPEWLRRTRRVRWSTGYTIISSIGQGDIQVTPLQMAIVTMIIANNGTYYKPQYVDKVVSSVTGDTIESFTPTVVRTVPVSKSNFMIIKRGMYAAVNKPHGTAYWHARIRGFNVFGKTGTAQVTRQVDFAEKEKKTGRQRAHAWFIAGAPYNEPKIVIAVFVENGGHGSTAAAPIAKKVLLEYYKILKKGGNV